MSGPAAVLRPDRSVVEVALFGPEPPFDIGSRGSHPVARSVTLSRATAPVVLRIAGPRAPLTTLRRAGSEARAGARASPLLNCVSSTHLMIFVTRPAPTVRPPSRIANLRPSSMAIGWMSSTDISVLSPGMTISVPSGSETTPVTSVVRK